MITGDRRFLPGHPRYDLMRSAVDDLQVVYWGRGSFWPKLPQGAYDVVTAQDPFWRGLFGWYAAKRLGAKLNVQVHADLDSVSATKHILMQIVLRHADSVRVVSQNLKAQAGKLAPKTKVGVLPVYVDLERYRAIVREPHDGKVVLWLGRFEDEKDPLLAVEVFKKLHAQGSHASFVMLGAGSLQRDLEKAAADFPVSFPGWHDPLPYLAQADVVLCTSKFESWGASVVEALAAGVPVVSPDVGVAREAGAIVVSRELMPGAVVEALRSGMRGTLKLELLSGPEWAQHWRTTLV